MTKIALEFTGGLGKNIAFTAVLPYLKQKSTILCTFPAVFENNPFVERFIPWPSSPFEILSEYDIFKVEPYYLAAYRKGEISLITAISRILDISVPNNARPLLYLTADEIKNAKVYLSQFKPPIILFQPFGASTNPSNPAASNQRSLSKTQARSIATFLSKFGTVLVFRSLNQPYLQGFVHPDVNLRFSLSLVHYADALIGVDSWLHHAGAALNKPGFFIFTSTDPNQLSYPLHTIIQPNKECSLFPCRRPWPGVPDSFVCPFGLSCQKFELDFVFAELEEYLKRTLL